MTVLGSVSDRELEAIMKSARRVRPAPDVVRARLLARARAAVAAEAATRPLPAIMAAPPSTHGRRLAAVAALTLALGAGGAVAALHARARRHLQADPTVQRAPENSPARISVPPQAAEEAPSVPAPSARPAHLHRSVSLQESYAAELQLLQRAQSQYTGEDFQSALVLIAEHAHRFPNGRLAEEREALRVKSLAGAGRSDEARRALVAFARRFPHSALQLRLRQTVQHTEE